jgi:hypothetical protein
MGNLFENFGDNFKSWVIMGIAVMAFFIAAHMLVSMFPQSGPLGAVRAGVLSA